MGVTQEPRNSVTTQVESCPNLLAWGKVGEDSWQPVLLVADVALRAQKYPGGFRQGLGTRSSSHHGSICLSKCATPGEQDWPGTDPATSQGVFDLKVKCAGVGGWPTGLREQTLPYSSLIAHPIDCVPSPSQRIHLLKFLSPGSVGARSLWRQAIANLYFLIP